MKYLLSFLFITNLVYANVPKWEIRPDVSYVNFTIVNFGLDVHGSFEGLKGTILFDPNNLDGSSINASVDVSTVNTKNGKRDEHLQKEEYFNAAAHPTIVVKTTKIAKSETGYIAQASITIKGITKSMAISFTFDEKDGKAAFKAKFTVNRYDFGVGSDSTTPMKKDVALDILIVGYKKA